MCGYIKLFRKFTEWEWYKDSTTKEVFLHLLLTANYKKTKFEGEEILPGQVIVGRKKLATVLRLSEQRVRTALKHLEDSGEIVSKSTNKKTLVTIVKWRLYQGDELQDNQQLTNNQPTTNQQLTNNQPTTNQQLTTSKEGKKVRREEYNNNIYGEFANVSLSEEELEKLKERFPYDWQDRIDRLSAYMKSKGKRYKSHYATLLSWARREKDKSDKSLPDKGGFLDL